MGKKITIFLSIVILIALFFLFYSYKFPAKIAEQSSFSVTPALFRIILNQGETISTYMSISDLGEKDNFNISIADLENIVSVDKNSITLDKGSSSQLKISISGAGTPGAYMGGISVFNSEEKKEIPFLVEIHTAKQFFAINLDASPENKQLKRGNNLSVNEKFFNLYDSSAHSLNINYDILDTSGKKILSDSETATIGLSSSFTKVFSLPQDIPIGNYAFVTSLNYSGTITTSSYMFSVISGNPISSFFSLDFLTYLIILFVAIVSVLVVYMLYERYRLFSQLRRQQHIQMKNFSERIAEEKRKRLAKARTERQKRKVIGEIQDAKGKVIAEMRKQQSEQINEMRKLKRKDAKYRERKMEQWKKEGYSKALKTAQINRELKGKLSALKNAFDAGFIQKESYDKDVSRLKYASKKLKRNLYK